MLVVEILSVFHSPHFTPTFILLPVTSVFSYAALRSGIELQVDCEESADSVGCSEDLHPQLVGEHETRWRLHVSPTTDIEVLPNMKPGRRLVLSRLNISSAV